VQVQEKTNQNGKCIWAFHFVKEEENNPYPNPLPPPNITIIITTTTTTNLSKPSHTIGKKRTQNF
jgi:hypothetical protein